MSPRFPFCRRLAHVILAAWAFVALVAYSASGLAQATSRADTGLPTVEGEASHTGKSETGVVQLYNRRIVTFHASLLGYSPRERAEVARASVQAAVRSEGRGRVTASGAGEAVRFDIDGVSVFFLVPEDLGPRAGVTLEQGAEEVRRALQTVVLEGKEMRDPVTLAKGAAFAVAATLITYVLVKLLFRLRRRLDERLDRAIRRSQERLRVGGITAVQVDQALSIATWLTTALAWALALLALDAWLSFVLQQFAYTRPWGERLTAWLLGVLGDFALGMVGAVPGLVVAVLVFVFARFATRIITMFLDRVERGNVRLGWLDADTAGPTRRISNFVVWLFALAMAYPYLPGAGSEAFKGVSVLVGLMVSLGASSIVGQALSGLSLMYSRSLRPGEYVKIGETEGTVTAVGMFATKVHTGMGEEVSIPNTVIVGNPVRNFSRLVKEGAFVLHTSVTIGYATPWRQVHAMLLEAARRTPGIARDPAPFVVQTALSDYYVEYRLCAQSGKDAPRRRADAMNNLHANIQDVFNEHGVQIMSPHYVADPSEPQVVPPERWHAPPAAAEAPETGAGDPEKRGAATGLLGERPAG